VKLPLNWRTKNYVGTIFGEHVRRHRPVLHDDAAEEPRRRLRRLGQGIRDPVQKPGQETLYATFTITDEEIEAIRAELAAAETDSVDRHYTVELVDEDRTVHATVRKTVYVTTDRSKGA